MYLIQEILIELKREYVSLRTMGFVNEPETHRGPLECYTTKLRDVSAWPGGWVTCGHASDTYLLEHAHQQAARLDS